jgi:hypothetical protein
MDNIKCINAILMFCVFMFLADIGCLLWVIIECIMANEIKISNILSMCIFILCSYVAISTYNTFNSRKKTLLLQQRIQVPVPIPVLNQVIAHNGEPEAYNQPTYNANDT